MHTILVVGLIASFLRPAVAQAVVVAAEPVSVDSVSASGSGIGAVVVGMNSVPVVAAAVTTATASPLSSVAVPVSVDIITSDSSGSAHATSCNAKYDGSQNRGPNVIATQFAAVPTTVPETVVRDEVVGTTTSDNYYGSSSSGGDGSAYNYRDSGYGSDNNSTRGSDTGYWASGIGAHAVGPPYTIKLEKAAEQTGSSVSGSDAGSYQGESGGYGSYRKRRLARLH